MSDLDKIYIIDFNSSKKYELKLLEPSYYKLCLLRQHVLGFVERNDIAEFPDRWICILVTVSNGEYCLDHSLDEVMEILSK